MIRNRICQALLLTTALAVCMVAVGASSAMAAPKGEFAVFAQCPLTNPNTEACFVANTGSGEIKVGKEAVAITKTQTLQGGLHNLEPFGKEFIAAANGETLTKAPQKTPGGLTGINCAKIEGKGIIEIGLRLLCESIFANKLTAVYATTELAVPANEIGLNEPALETGMGTALYLPVKIKLENPLLGNECYIGSNAEPVKLELTSGTSGTLKGKVGTISSKAEGKILEIANNTIVQSGFKTPGVKGCGPFGLLDGLVNEKIGLPASTGNAAVLNNTIYQANAEFVAESEG